MYPQSGIKKRLTDQCLANGVLVTRRKGLMKSPKLAKGNITFDSPVALKVCVTTGLTRKEIEKAGTTIRHAVTKVVKARR